MRVIARATLTKFVSHRVERRLQRTVKEHLDAWFAEVSEAEWKTSADLKQQYRSASIISAERVAFNIKGNDFRLIVSINYAYGVLFIKWIGTHREYDAVAAEEVDYDEDRYGHPSR